MQLILMVTDGRMTEMLTNLIANLRALRMEHYLVLASDAAVCTTLVAGGEVHGVGRGCGQGGALVVAVVHHGLAGQAWAQCALHGRGRVLPCQPLPHAQGNGLAMQRW
jgi:hypothetical protein